MISDKMLEMLRERVFLVLSKRRYNHTLGVEKMARFLALHCLPEKIKEISAAALLHDITKEIDLELQYEILKDNNDGILDMKCDISPEIIHSFTAPYIVKRDFSDFAIDEILSAIAKHTVGDAYMSVFDRIIFLADFIEETRTYPESVITREFVVNSMKTDCISENIRVLTRACVMEIDSTISHLEKIGKTVYKNTILAKNSLISKM